MSSQPVLIFTGGHHNSALATAEKLQSQGVKIIWLGHRQSMWNDNSDSAEYKDVTAAGITFFELKAGKFHRTYNPAKLIRLPFGFLAAWRLLYRFKKQYGQNLKGIISFGGYLAAPVIFCGWLLNIPSLTHEQTLTIGWSNKFISLFVKKIALTWEQSLAHSPSKKSIVTGLPLRETLKSVRISPTHPPTIYITGGKQGSHLINQAVFTALPKLLESYQIIHQTGNNSVTGDFNQAKKIQSELPENLQNHYHVYDYLTTNLLSEVLSKSSLVVSRSGAHITYELAYLGLTSVLIPIPWSSHQEQLTNARLLESAQQAILLPEKELTPDKLIFSIDKAKLLQPLPLKIEKNGLDNLVNLIKAEFL